MADAARLLEVQVEIRSWLNTIHAAVHMVNSQSCTVPPLTPSLPWGTMLLRYLLQQAWTWFAESGLKILLIVVIALLIPRIGRYVHYLITQNLERNSDDADHTKAQLAIAGAVIYVVQIVAYFVLLVLLLQAIGFSLAGAAIPATVVSAAVGFGAQSIIADFLAGFFILSERQFGVGDWVRFEGAGVTVEGTVIKVTMRATRIRTMAEETVIIPNSVAKVCINSSNAWSKAVVEMPVPLLSSKNVQEAIDRTHAAAQRALRRDDVAPTLLDDMVVQPATDVTPPTTVGMPWMMTMRIMVQVSPGSQWLVERAIRVAILDEFWSEYGSATTTSGEMNSSTQIKTETPAPSDKSDTLEQPQRLDPAAEEAPVEPPHMEYNDKLRNVLSLNGRIRVSTSLLLLGIVVILILQVLTVQTGPDSDVPDGWLSPARYSSSPTSEPSPTPTYTVQSETQVNTPSPTDISISEDHTEETADSTADNSLSEEPEPTDTTTDSRVIPETSSASTPSSTVPRTSDKQSASTSATPSADTSAFRDTEPSEQVK